MCPTHILKSMCSFDFIELMNLYTWATFGFFVFVPIVGLLITVAICVMYAPVVEHGFVVVLVQLIQFWNSNEFFDSCEMKINKIKHKRSTLSKNVNWISNTVLAKRNGKANIGTQNDWCPRIIVDCIELTHECASIFRLLFQSFQKKMKIDQFRLSNWHINYHHL